MIDLFVSSKAKFAILLSFLLLTNIASAQEQPLVLERMVVRDITSSSATVIVRLTDPRPLEFLLERGPETAQEQIISTDSRITHRVEFTNLIADTRYFFKLESRGSSSGNFSFKTTQNETSSLSLERVETSPLGEGEVAVSFTLATSGPAYINFGTDPSSLLSRGPVETSSLKRHRQRLKGLEPGTRYFYQIKSGDRLSETLEFTTEGALAVERGPEISASGNEATILFELERAGPAKILYGISADNLSNTGPVEESSLKTHRQRLKNLNSGQTYFFRIDSGGQLSRVFDFNAAGSTVTPIVPGVTTTSTTTTTTLAPAPNTTTTTLSTTTTTQPATTGSEMSFDEIGNRGLSNGCYPTNDHYLAEYLFQNPETCFWNLDAGKRTVSAVDVPQPPQNAVSLPSPSGGDDTNALAAVINANRGGAVVGSGTYKVNNLVINVPIDIFNMKMEPAGSAAEIVVIRSPDVRIFNSPIDAKNSRVLRYGFHVVDGAHRFTLVKSGVSNVYHTNNESMSGVRIRSVDDFHIACNRFVNLVNDTNDKTLTARANAIWMNGGQTGSTSGGYIVNNYAEEHQSNGARKDSEFFTTQSYAKTDPAKPVKLFANRTLNAGKRLVKFQEGDGLILSNFNEWRVKDGPLGPRTLLATFAIHFSDNVIVRNNRIEIGASSRFDYVFHSNRAGGNKRQDNIHFDCNDIEIKDRFSPTSGSRPKLMVFRASQEASGSTGHEASNSSASNNRVHGNGSVLYHYWFGEGYDDDGGPIDISGNVIDIPATGGTNQRP